LFSQADEAAEFCAALKSVLGLQRHDVGDDVSQIRRGEGDSGHVGMRKDNRFSHGVPGLIRLACDLNEDRHFVQRQARLITGHIMAE
jgi:hypothetical protein